MTAIPSTRAVHIPTGLAIVSVATRREVTSQGERFLFMLSDGSKAWAFPDQVRSA